MAAPVKTNTTEGGPAFVGERDGACVGEAVGVAGVGALGYVALALADVVPGGWRLRALFVPQAVIDAAL